MGELAHSTLKDFFKPDTIQTYSIIFKTRNNNQVKRDDTINTFAKVVRELNKSAKVEFKVPDLCIVVEVIRNVCCLGVVKEYFKYKKYNLVEMAKAEEENKVDEVCDEASESTEDAEQRTKPNLHKSRQSLKPEMTQ